MLVRDPLLQLRIGNPWKAWRITGYVAGEEILEMQEI